MPTTLSRKLSSPKKTAVPGPKGTLRDAVILAGENGLLAGTRTHVIRGRMPAALVKEAKRRSGISSDSKLLEAALANIAVTDEYWQWLKTQRGTIPPDIDLEF